MYWRNMNYRRIGTCTVMWVKLSALTCDVWITWPAVSTANKWPYHFLIPQYLNIFYITLFRIVCSVCTSLPLLQTQDFCTWLKAFHPSRNSSFGHQKAPKEQLLQANRKWFVTDVLAVQYDRHVCTNNLKHFTVEFHQVSVNSKKLQKHKPQE